LCPGFGLYAGDTVRSPIAVGREGLMDLKGGVGVAKSANGAIRVVIGDRRRLIGEALAALIETLEGFTVTGVLAGDQAITAIAAQNPDLALVGVGEDTDGAVELVQTFTTRAPNADIVLVADTAAPELVRFVLDRRLSGLLLTDTSGAEMAVNLGQVAHGHAILPCGWRRALSPEEDDPLELLSERQLQVLSLLADGCSYEEIGKRLYITLNTVKFHVRSIFLRLGVRNRMAAARMLSNRKNKATRLSNRHTG
jgi:two-component system, NarL family, nitrate/nitrite response regulator NarP